MKQSSILFLMLAILFSCTRSEQPVTTTEEEPAPAVFRMVLNGGITLWDATKGDPVDWVDGQAIYIGLSNGTSLKKVVARYYSSNAEWRISYDGSLADFSSGDCKCYYIVDQNYANTDISLSYNSVIYADENAKFSIVDNELQVSANLTPLTGRIKFAYPQYSNRTRYRSGVTGLSYFSKLDLNTFEFSVTDDPIQYDLRSDTDTYLYVRFNRPDCSITVWDRSYNDYVFTRRFKAETLEPGKSNWLYWPIYDYHNEWKCTDYYISVGENEFVYIIPGTFNMGGEDAQPIHQVTISKPYYIGRYEVRQTLWTDITGEEYDSNLWANDYWYPAFGKSWEQVNNFIKLLNARYSDQGGYRFRLPTEAEWEYAAKSGVYKWSNIYASTSDYNQVVWDGVTSTPGNLQDWYTNGLSMWGVSGNVSEWVSDWYADYTDVAVTDPKGPATGEKHIKRGGARNSPDSKFLTVTYRDAEESDNSMAGLRLVMDVNQ